MDNEKQRKMLGVLTSGTLILSALPLASSVPAALASEQDQATGEGAGQVTAATFEWSDAAREQVSIKNVQGTFSWDQGASTDNATLKRNLYSASKTLCGVHGNLAELAGGAESATADAAQTGPIDTIAVTGDVGCALSASVDEYITKAPVKRMLGCSCIGNPANGRASANAQVKGFRLAALLADAQVADDANTITFTSRDGYQVALPLSYVMQRYSIIVTQVNGESMEDALGCENQLWLGNTSARSFARDIVSIEVTHEDTPPAAPGASDAANQPNVGVTDGELAS